MALFNLQGRWIDLKGYEINIVMTGATDFNFKAVSAQLLPYWKGGYGQVFESGKVNAVFTGGPDEVPLSGSVTPGGRTIDWVCQPKSVWKRQ